MQPLGQTVCEILGIFAFRQIYIHKDLGHDKTWRSCLPQRQLSTTGATGVKISLFTWMERRDRQQDHHGNSHQKKHLLLNSAILCQGSFLGPEHREVKHGYLVAKGIIGYLTPPAPYQCFAMKPAFFRAPSQKMPGPPLAAWSLEATSYRPVRTRRFNKYPPANLLGIPKCNTKGRGWGIQKYPRLVANAWAHMFVTQRFHLSVGSGTALHPMNFLKSSRVTTV